MCARDRLTQPTLELFSLESSITRNRANRPAIACADSLLVYVADCVRLLPPPPLSVAPPAPAAGNHAPVGVSSAARPTVSSSPPPPPASSPPGWSIDFARLHVKTIGVVEMTANAILRRVAIVDLPAHARPSDRPSLVLAQTEVYARDHKQGKRRIRKLQCVPSIRVRDVFARDQEKHADADAAASPSSHLSDSFPAPAGPQPTSWLIPARGCPIMDPAGLFFDAPRGQLLVGGNSHIYAVPSAAFVGPTTQDSWSTIGTYGGTAATRSKDRPEAKLSATEIDIVTEMSMARDGLGGLVAIDRIDNGTESARAIVRSIHGGISPYTDPDVVRLCSIHETCEGFVPLNGNRLLVQAGNNEIWLTQHIKDTRRNAQAAAAQPLPLIFDSEARGANAVRIVQMDDGGVIVAEKTQLMFGRIWKDDERGCYRLDIDGQSGVDAEDDIRSFVHGFIRWARFSNIKQVLFIPSGVPGQPGALLIIDEHFIRIACDDRHPWFDFLQKFDLTRALKRANARCGDSEEAADYRRRTTAALKKLNEGQQRKLRPIDQRPMAAVEDVPREERAMEEHKSAARPFPPSSFPFSSSLSSSSSSSMAHVSTPSLSLSRAPATSLPIRIVDRPAAAPAPAPISPKPVRKRGRPRKTLVAPEANRDQSVDADGDQRMAERPASAAAAASFALGDAQEQPEEERPAPYQKRRCFHVAAPPAAAAASTRYGLSAGERTFPSSAPVAAMRSSLSPMSSIPQLSAIPESFLRAPYPAATPSTAETGAGGDSSAADGHHALLASLRAENASLRSENASLHAENRASRSAAAELRSTVESQATAMAAQAIQSASVLHRLNARLDATDKMLRDEIARLSEDNDKLMELATGSARPGATR